MGNNSIRSSLTRDDIISDIILSIGADIKRENVYVLVEGQDDISLIYPYLSENVLIYESYDGKSGVEVIVENYFAENDRVIGIRDRDYQIDAATERMFYYDYGCMEMMLVSNDDVFNNLCFEYYRGEMESKMLRSNLLNQLCFLSTIRMYNEREQWGLVLKGISVNQAWDSEQFMVNDDIIIDKVNKMNNNFIDSHILLLLQNENSSAWTYEKCLLYTQGHDFFTLFATVCNQYKKKGIKHTDVEASARCIFRWSDLIKTELYAKIGEYSKSQGIKILV